MVHFLPPGFALTSSLPWHRANFSMFYDGPADTWMQGLDVGAVVHWTCSIRGRQCQSDRSVKV